MKLAIVTATFPPEVNGVAMTFGVIARELAQRGHQVTIFLPQRNDPTAIVDQYEGSNERL